MRGTVVGVAAGALIASGGTLAPIVGYGLVAYGIGSTVLLGGEVISGRSAESGEPLSDEEQSRKLGQLLGGQIGSKFGFKLGTELGSGGTAWGRGPPETPEVLQTTNPVETDSGQAVFWSGIKGSEATAKGWASENGKATLAMILAERGIELPRYDPANPTSVALWRGASAAFAHGARGNVKVLLGDVRPNSIWATVEFPALKANPNVTSITAVNPTTGGETILWTR